MAFFRKISGKYWMELSEKEAMDVKASEGRLAVVHPAGPKGIFLIEVTEAVAETTTGTANVWPDQTNVSKMEPKPNLTQPLMDKAVIRGATGAVPASEKNTYLLSKSGFLFTKNESKAKELSDQFYIAFKEKKVRGLKDFDGTFYVFDESAYQKYVQLAAAYLREQKKVKVEELATAFSWSPDLTRGLCCFLKEDGLILEKNKGTYQFID